MFSRFKYAGSAPGADSATYVLFSTVAAGLPANAFAMAGVHRVVADIKTANAEGNYTLNTYRSDDRGTNWKQLSTEAVTAPADTATIVRDYIVEQVADWKLEFVNNGTAKPTITVNFALTDQRSTLT